MTTKNAPGARGAGVEAKAVAGRRKSGFRRFDVLLRREGVPGWTRHGVVDLRDFAPGHDVELALSKIGVYAPRGRDTLKWSGDEVPSAVIREFGLRPMVKLVPSCGDAPAGKAGRRGTQGTKGPSRPSASKVKGEMVAIDPRTGLHVRPATASETAVYLAQPVRAACFRKPVRVGEVLVDEYTGPGVWFGGAGF